MVGMALLFAACGNKTETSAEVVLETETDSISYFLGVNIGKNLKESGLMALNEDNMKAGLLAGYNDDSLDMDPQMMQFFVMNYFDKVERQKVDQEMVTLENWLKENRNWEEIKRADQGYFYRIIQEAEGEKPAISDAVVVHYTGKLLDGTTFDSSIPKGEPVEFRLMEVIQGWGLGMQLMSVGAKYEFFFPSYLAYGPSRGPGNSLPPNSPLTFEVELLDIVKAQQP